MVGGLVAPPPNIFGIPGIAGIPAGIAGGVGIPGIAGGVTPPGIILVAAPNAPPAPPGIILVRSPAPGGIIFVRSPNAAVGFEAIESRSGAPAAPITLPAALVAALVAAPIAAPCAIFIASPASWSLSPITLVFNATPCVFAPAIVVTDFDIITMTFCNKRHNCSVVPIPGIRLNAFIIPSTDDDAMSRTSLERIFSIFFNGSSTAVITLSAISFNLFISVGLSDSCGMAFFRLILEERSEDPPWIRSFHHFLIRRMTKMALFLAVVPISGYFSSSSRSSFFLSAFLFCSMNTMIFVRSGSSDSSNAISRPASLASASASASASAAGALSSSSSSSSGGADACGCGGGGFVMALPAAAAAADAAAAAAAVAAVAAVADAADGGFHSRSFAIVHLPSPSPSPSPLPPPPRWVATPPPPPRLISWFDFTISCNNSNITNMGVTTLGRNFCSSSSSSGVSRLPCLCLRSRFSIK